MLDYLSKTLTFWAFWFPTSPWTKIFSLNIITSVAVTIVMIDISFYGVPGAFFSHKDLLSPVLPDKEIVLDSLAYSGFTVSMSSRLPADNQGYAGPKDWRCCGCNQQQRHFLPLSSTWFLLCSIRSTNICRFSTVLFMPRTLSSMEKYKDIKLL